jgi:hypothetical protein
VSVEFLLGAQARSSLLQHRAARTQPARRTSQNMGQKWNRSLRGGENHLERIRVLERICLGSRAARQNLSELSVRRHCREMSRLLAVLAETRSERKRPAA